MGQLLDSEASENLCQQRKTFLRIKVRIPLNQPLASGFSQKRHNQPPTWVQFKYERFSNFCFSCSRLGNSKIYCPFEINPDAIQPFGPKMRAKPPPSLKIENILISPRHNHNPSQVPPFLTLPLLPSSNPPKRTQKINC